MSLKVTYKTKEGYIVNTFLPDGTDVVKYMRENRDNVEVIKIRPSVKKEYTHCFNKFQK